MAQQDKKKSEAKPKATRKQLSPEERIAKAEADLQALRDKAEAKATKQINVLLERRQSLLVRIDGLVEKVNVIDHELDDLGYIEDDTEPQPELAISGTEAEQV